MNNIQLALKLSSDVYQRPSFRKDSEKVLYHMENDTLTIAFAGSDDVHDFIENFHFSKKRISVGEGYALVHTGFWESWLQVRSKVISHIRKTKPKCVRFVGHSKGGAMAICACVDLSYHIGKKDGINIKNISPITFGAPKVFSSSSINFLNKHFPLHSIPLLHINQGDPVPDLPRRYMGFNHWGNRFTGTSEWWQRIYFIRGFTGTHDLSRYNKSFG